MHVCVITSLDELYVLGTEKNEIYSTELIILDFKDIELVQDKQVLIQ